MSNYRIIAIFHPSVRLALSCLYVRLPYCKITTIVVYSALIYFYICHTTYENMYIGNWSKTNQMEKNENVIELSVKFHKLETKCEQSYKNNEICYNF